LHPRDGRALSQEIYATFGQILDILTDESIVGYQAINILANGRYIRVNSELKKQPGLAAAPDDAMDDVGEKNIRKLRALGKFWFERYGSQAVELLMGEYDGPSLDRIDPDMGDPIRLDADGSAAPAHS
ncbi:MAG: hypothetical protein OXU36_11585, partial [Candidatus Poribacteria bacterium]|nr:hypothetical protein [Candidatus Poribacteria bacterium]